MFSEIWLSFEWRDENGHTVKVKGEISSEIAYKHIFQEKLTVMFH